MAYGTGNSELRDEQKDIFVLAEVSQSVGQSSTQSTSLLVCVPLSHISTLLK